MLEQLESVKCLWIWCWDSGVCEVFMDWCWNSGVSEVLLG